MKNLKATIIKKPTLHTEIIIIDEKEYEFKFYKVKLGTTENETRFGDNIKTHYVERAMIYSGCKLDWRNEEDRKELMKNLRKASKENKKQKELIREYVEGKDLKRIGVYLGEPQKYITKEGDGRFNERLLYHM
jgi:hypothetical protein